MRPQKTHLCVRFGAIFTLKRFFLCVHYSVPPQLPSFNERLFTLVTMKCPLSTVNLLVGFQSPCLCKELETLFAREWLFTSVYPLVAHKTAGLFK